MKTINRTTTQREISKRLGVNPSYFCKIIHGKKRPTADKAAMLETSSGIGIRTWLYGKPTEIKKELEKVYGKINFLKGRFPKQIEVK
jgi:transcriptional regulator with XRE-family HTH domain